MSPFKEYRFDKKSCLAIYTDPKYFFNSWIELKNKEKTTKEEKKKKAGKKRKKLIRPAAKPVIDRKYVAAQRKRWNEAAQGVDVEMDIVEQAVPIPTTPGFIGNTQTQMANSIPSDYDSNYNYWSPYLVKK